MAKEEKLRCDIEDKYKWDLSVYYKTEEEYESDFNILKNLTNKITEYKGKITSSDDNLYNFLKLNSKIEEISTNLFIYAMSKNDEDVADEKNQKRYNEIQSYFSIINEKTSFASPELLNTKYSIIKDYINNNSDLKEYSFELEEIYRYQKYTLSEKEEKLLANISDLQNKYENSFSIIMNSVIDYGYIKDESDCDVKLTNGNYSKYIRSSDRRVRKDAFYAKVNTLKKYVNLLATDYEGSIKADAIIAKARGYESSMDMYLYPDGVTKEIYNTMLATADKNIDILYKYYKLIKDVLKLEELEIYDLSAPLTKISNKIYTPEDAKKLIMNALNIYGDEYVSIIEKAFDNNWIDFYPNKGKKSGYYQDDGFKGNPVILANFTDDYNSVSSVCHELGHAMHSHYSDLNNKKHLSKYEIIVAEVASLTNEILLSSYVVKTSNDKNEKLNAINNILEIFSNNFFGTLSEGSVFEKKVHEKVFNGESLTAENFNNIFKNINDRFYGPLIENKEDIKYNWARVPHFYTPFYYYKYSIGICGACFVVKRILDGDKEYLNKYLNFLKLGGTMMPLDELKTIDLDFNSTEIIESGIKYFDDLIDEFIKIYNS